MQKEKPPKDSKKDDLAIVVVTYTNEDRAVANGTENPRKVNATSICPTDICF